MSDNVNSIRLAPGIRALAAKLGDAAANIASERKESLERLAAITARHLRESGEAALTFICTHNSRRSHLSQITAQMAAVYQELDGIHCFSGGTEATACNPRTVAAFERAGFAVTASGNSENPVYSISIADQGEPLELWSKVYDQDGNPTTGYVAVMTCTHADENCPVVAGADDRVSLPFVDPKVADDTPEESATYDERLREIGSQMFWLMAEVKKSLEN